MSKERLKEIENKILQATNEDDEDVIYASICAESVLEDLQWTVGYAKEQIERVQELEDILEQDARQGVLEGLYEENKRYREAIERIKEAPRKAHSGSDCVDIIFEIIEALESESEE